MVQLKSISVSTFLLAGITCVSSVAAWGPAFQAGADSDQAGAVAAQRVEEAITRLQALGEHFRTAVENQTPLVADLTRDVQSCIVERNSSERATEQVNIVEAGQYAHGVLGPENQQKAMLLRMSAAGSHFDEMMAPWKCLQEVFHNERIGVKSLSDVAKDSAKDVGDIAKNTAKMEKKSGVAVDQAAVRQARQQSKELKNRASDAQHDVSDWIDALYNEVGDQVEGKLCAMEPVSVDTAVPQMTQLRLALPTALSACGGQSMEDSDTILDPTSAYSELHSFVTYIHQLGSNQVVEELGDRTAALIASQDALQQAKLQKKKLKAQELEFKSSVEGAHPLHEEEADIARNERGHALETFRCVHRAQEAAMRKLSGLREMAVALDADGLESTYITARHLVYTMYTNVLERAEHVACQRRSIPPSLLPTLAAEHGHLNGLSLAQMIAAVCAAVGGSIAILQISSRHLFKESDIRAPLLDTAQSV